MAQGGLPWGQKKEGCNLRQPSLIKTCLRLLIIHSSHSTHATSGHGRSFLFLRNVRNGTLGGKQQAGTLFLPRIYWSLRGVLPRGFYSKNRTLKNLLTLLIIFSLCDTFSP